MSAAFFLDVEIEREGRLSDYRADLAAGKDQSSVSRGAGPFTNCSAMA
jgi:hypothetical protein